MVNGRIGRPGDWDVFRFEGRAGDAVVAEVHARRLDSPLDSVLRLTDDGGRELTVNDDREDKGAGLTTHHADSKIEFALPEAQSVKLAIFAVDGHRIATLKNEFMSAGYHSVIWNGHDDQGKSVASGIYFYSIQAGDFSLTRKMTLLK